MSEQIDFEQMAVEMEHFASVVHGSGLVAEWRQLSNQMGFNSGVRELIKRHPELSQELDVEALAS